MTATDVLRRLLDERSEYYRTSGNRTWWGRPIDAQTGKPINVFHNQAQPMGEDRLLVELQLATPEQAIAATLGAGTCKNMDSDTDAEWFTCSECNTELRVHEPFDAFSIHYCPNCGRKVVDDG